MAWSFVRAGTTANGTTSPLTVSFTSNAAGDVLVALIGMSLLTDATTGVTDTAGNTWVHGASFNNPGANGGVSYSLWYVPHCAASASTNTISIAWTPGGARLVSAPVEFSLGVGNQGNLDLTGSAGSSVTTTAFTVAASATNAGELVVASTSAIPGFGSRGTYTAGTGFTNAVNASNSYAVDYNLSGSSGSNSDAATVGTAAGFGGAAASFVAATFVPPGGGQGGSEVFIYNPILQPLNF